MYDLIVLGATFAAAGIAQKFRKRCLIIERGTRAGYEFYGALNFGASTQTADLSSTALALEEKLYQSPDGVYGSERHIYPLLNAANVVFGASPVSIERNGNAFVCKVLGVSGFVTYEGKSVVDTRCHEWMCLSKHYNFLMESPCVPNFAGVCYRQIPARSHYVISCPVPLSCSYPEARMTAFQVMQQFSDSQRLILSADEFDYHVQSGYPEIQEGILYLPSKGYETPALAFDAGLHIEEVE